MYLVASQKIAQLGTVLRNIWPRVYSWKMLGWIYRTNIIYVAVEFELFHFTVKYVG